MPKVTKEKTDKTTQSDVKKKIEASAKKTKSNPKAVSKTTTKRTSSTKVKTPKDTATEVKISKTSKSAKSSTKTPKKASSKSQSTTAKAISQGSKTKKSATKGTKKTSTKKALTLAEKGEALLTDKFTVLEYYDLPYHYEQTVVKILAQTPNSLFIYWNLSSNDVQNLKKQYGENFFEVTKPILIIYNKTMDYRFEIEINDFSNCWYLKVKDAKCEYQIELGRKVIPQEKYTLKEPTDYIFISTSNEIEAPNDHILIEKLPNTISFKNVKNNVITNKKIDTLPKKDPILKILRKIYAFYGKEYMVEDAIPTRLDLRNPSSWNPTSTFK